MCISLTSALDGGEWSTSRPGHFTPGEEILARHAEQVAGLASADLDVLEKRKISLLLHVSRPVSSSQ